MAKTAKSPASKSGREAQPSPDSLSFEQAMEEAQEITERLDRGEIGLEESLVAFKRGMALLQRCRAILDVAEQEVRQITGEQTDAVSEEQY